ncbi:MAG: molybdenum cofactor guanylyltransferase [Promethearchaeota archaeon]|nr:MAG: molybdenum cofactor guanylyltransferase [Candidatus Lokiarchaeota archaeon]
MKLDNEKYLAILILIGGKSNRFGTEKPAIDLLGKPLILHQIDILYKFDHDLFLVAHSEEQIYEFRKQIEFPEQIKFIVDDREIFNYPKFYKPMLGIYSGFKELNNLGFEKAFVLSGDMPLIKPEVVNLMINESLEYECTIPRWNNGFLEPFFAIYPVLKGFQKAKEILTNENYGLYNFIDKDWNINYISIEKAILPLDNKLLSFININGPIDIAKLLKIYDG